MGLMKHQNALLSFGLKTFMTLAAIGLVAVALFFFYTRSTQTEAPARPNPSEIYAADGGDRLYSPFSLQIDPMERLLLINFEQDPDEIYVGFEPQVFDDPVHGRGMLVIGWRVDGRVDVYHQPGLILDPATYDIAGQGLAEMVERPFTDAYFEVNAAGVDAYFAFDDLLGRRIEVTVQERNARPRKPFGLLAPMGSAAASPSALPLVFLHDFYFVRQGDTNLSIVVDGQARRPDALPIPLDGMRMHFTRYSPDPLIATLNPAYEGPLAPLERTGEQEARLGDLVFDLVDNQGRTEIVQMRRAFKQREIVVAFNPPLPHLLSLMDGAETSGIFTLRGDPSVGTVTGEYRIKRAGSSVEAQLTPGGGWRPNESKWEVRFLYWAASVFKQWPKTYLWTGSLDLTDPEQVTMQSAWRRTE